MNILVHKHNLEIAKAPVNEREINVSKINFTFDEELSNYTKEAYFTLNGNSYKVLLTNDECYIPSEALSEYGELEIGVVAFLVENDTEIKRYNPSPVYINTLVGSLKEAENSEPITPTDKEQIEKALNDGLDAIDNAISQVNTAIQETNNLNLDANKVGKEATITLTKKDGTQKIVKIEDGVSLQFMWQGTSLGIKTDDMQDYVFVNLQGIQGVPGPQGEPFRIKKTYSSVAEMNADFDNMNYGDYVMIASSVEVQDNAKLYTRGEFEWIFITDFSGATGIKGETGATPIIHIGTVSSGTTPSVTISGTAENPVFNFVLQPGEKGETGGKGDTGATGNGISNIEKTNETPSQSDYRINYTNGGHFDYSVLNGEVTKSQLEMLENALPHVTGTGTSITLNNTAKYPMKNVLNPSELSQESEPTPASPQDIHVITGNNSIKVENKNLFDINDDLHYSTSGAGITSVSDSYNSTDYLPCQIGDKFAISGVITRNTDYNLKVVFYDENKNYISRPVAVLGTAGNRESAITTAPSNARYVMAQFHYTVTDCQFEKSDIMTSYVPHQEQVKPLNLGDIEYCKIGDYADKFFKAIDGDSIYDTLDSTTKATLTSGKWYIQKNIGKVVLNGSETGWSSITGNAPYKFTSSVFPTFGSNETLLCNYYECKKWNDSWGNFNYLVVASNYGKAIQFRNININSLEDFKTWLSTHNTIVYYVLATPTYTLLNDTLQQQLDDIYNTMLSYQGQTNVSQVNDDLPFVITSKALKDISNL